MLRHSLDVMQIEKNNFDNIINLILDMLGKTKDNLKSRLNLPDIYECPELYVIDNGKGLIPIFILNAKEKKELFDWIIHSVKFPNGLCI